MQENLDTALEIFVEFSHGKISLKITLKILMEISWNSYKNLDTER